MEEQQPKNSIYTPEYNWLGRNLPNYISNHPKAKGAKTLTQARKMAFGEKPKRYLCRCGQEKCARASGAKSSHC